MSLCRWRVVVDVVCSLCSAVRANSLIRVRALCLLWCLVGGQRSKSGPRFMVLEGVGCVGGDAHGFAYDVAVELLPYAWYDDVGVVCWVQLFCECHCASWVGVGASGVHGCSCYFVDDVEVLPGYHAEFCGEVARENKVWYVGICHIDVGVVGAEVIYSDKFS